MTRIIALLFLMISTFFSLKSQSFAERQLQFERVKKAKENTEKIIKKLFRDSGLSENPRYIYWRGFKLEDELELWASDSSNTTYKKIKTYKICSGSGDLGPKRKMGDFQVPEGMYYIERYNPNSNFYLSMKISYPNESDLYFADKDNPGNEIFVHGSCESIGCLPMTDSAIMEIYWITVKSQSYQGPEVKIPFDIFPARFTKKNWEYLNKNYGHKPNVIKLWKNLNEATSFMETNKIPPGYWVDQKGYYHIVFPQNFHIYDPNH